MPELHLISHHLCPYVQRAVIVLTEKDIPHQRSYIDLANKPDWFSQLSPLGRVPILKTGEAIVFESQVIAEYLDEITEGSLHPDDPLRKARHRSWIEFGSETLKAIGDLYSAKDASTFEEWRTALRGKFERIDKEIRGPFFEGHEFHMIDGVWGTMFRYLDVFDQIEDFDLLTSLETTQEWRKSISARPSVVAAPPEGYPARLMLFLQKKNTHISSLMT